MLSAKRYDHFWVDGIYFGARGCILVIIAHAKELIAITDGSARRMLPISSGVVICPELVTGDGALGFWRRCRLRGRVHKTGIILNKPQGSAESRAKGHLQDSG